MAKGVSHRFNSFSHRRNRWLKCFYLVVMDLPWFDWIWIFST